jgi:dsDNA-binding SOS-regulon protein
MRSDFQARHLEMAEASKGSADSVGAILHAVRDLNVMLSQLPSEMDETIELDWSSYLECKKDLLAQLKDAREKENQRQMGSNTEVASSRAGSADLGDGDGEYQ